MLQASGPSNGSTNPESPVPLDTIPISPANGNDEDNDGNGEAQDGEAAAAATSEGGEPTKREYGEDEQITVFHDPNNFNVKHPLMHKWTLWFTKPPSGKVREPIIPRGYWRNFLFCAQWWAGLSKG